MPTKAWGLFVLAPLIFRGTYVELAAVNSGKKGSNSAIFERKSLRQKTLKSVGI